MTKILDVDINRAIRKDSPAPERSHGPISGLSIHQKTNQSNENTLSTKTSGTRSTQENHKCGFNDGVVRINDCHAYLARIDRNLGNRPQELADDHSRVDECSLDSFCTSTSRTRWFIPAEFFLFAPQFVSSAFCFRNGTIFSSVR